MALDKMVDSTQLDSDLTSVANAIRAKSGGSGQLAFPSGFVDAVEAIETGGSGDYTIDDFGDETKPSGAVTYMRPYILLQNNSGEVPVFARRTAITKIYMPNFNSTANISSRFYGDTAMVYAIMPKLTKIYNGTFYDCSSLKAFDWLGGEITGSAYHFVNCKKLNIMVIRRTASICSLATINAFNNTPFASGKAGGTLYVPNDLISSYQSASNWSTILGYPNNQIKSIESTHTDPDAPIDLTLYYIDGTPIPTT